MLSAISRSASTCVANTQGLSLSSRTEGTVTSPNVKVDAEGAMVDCCASVWLGINRTIGRCSAALSLGLFGLAHFSMISRISWRCRAGSAESGIARRANACGEKVPPVTSLADFGTEYAPDSDDEGTGGTTCDCPRIARGAHIGFSHLTVCLVNFPHAKGTEREMDAGAFAHCVESLLQAAIRQF